MGEPFDSIREIENFCIALPKAISLFKVEKELTAASDQITDLLLQSYQFFESHGPDTQREWRHYVEKARELLILFRIIVENLLGFGF